MSLHEIDAMCFSFFKVFDISLFCIVLPWTIWNWKLALSGITNVEKTERLFEIDHEDLISGDHDTEDLGKTRSGQYIDAVM